MKRFLLPAVFCRHHLNTHRPRLRKTTSGNCNFISTLRSSISSFHSVLDLRRSSKGSSRSYENTPAQGTSYHALYPGNMNPNQTPDILNVTRRRPQIKLESLAPTPEAFSISQTQATVNQDPSPSSPSALAFFDGAPSYNSPFPVQPPNNPADGLAGPPSLPESSSFLNPVRVPMPGQGLPPRRSKRISKPSRKAAEAEYDKMMNGQPKLTIRIPRWREHCRALDRAWRGCDAGRSL